MTSLHKIIHNNTEITNPVNIANAFNLHFSNVGNNFKNKLPRTNVKSFVDYLPQSNPHYLSQKAKLIFRS